MRNTKENMVKLLNAMIYTQNKLLDTYKDDKELYAHALGELGALKGIKILIIFNHKFNEYWDIYKDTIKELYED